MTDNSEDQLLPRNLSGQRVGLLVTCLVDFYRPNIGFATIKLLQQAGYEVDVPDRQTCCGQPAYNSGDYATAAKIARQVIMLFEDYDYVVVPSGSCASMLKDFPRLFESVPEWQERAISLAERTWELLSFLTDVCGVTSLASDYTGKITYHDSCTGLRQLGISSQPRMLLQSLAGLQLIEMPDSDTCCGFGGTFCVKYPAISGRMVMDKVNNIMTTGADTVAGGDLGCLLNIAGRLQHARHKVKVFHIAEILADMADIPGLGEGETD
ncbi:MAG: (Fe-S)-binding protein [Gammaproteobacteria bacterium]